MNSIPEFIESHLAPVVDECVAFARTRVPAAHDFTVEELADHAKVLLIAIAADVREEQGAREQHEKSQGNDPGNAPDVTRIAREHAAQRFEQGFTFDHLVSEFRALRASVIRRWTAQIDKPRTEDLQELTRFGEAMDQALSESASLYTKKVEDSRNLLLGVLGHDLRTPLGVVQMSATYLLRTDTLDGAQTKAAARILTSSERMTAMIRDILDFTQTAFGVSLPLTPSPNDMGVLARAIVNEVRTLVPGSMIELVTQGDLAGRWDGARIGQLLSNLVANAVQHGEKSHPVKLRVRGNPDHVEVEVGNKGAPISREAQKTLFLPLQQAAVAESERRAGSSGLGLGLYITREIAVAHGGSIKVESTEADTIFRVILPRIPPVAKDRRSQLRS